MSAQNAMNALHDQYSKAFTEPGSSVRFICKLPVPCITLNMMSDGKIIAALEDGSAVIVWHDAATGAWEMRPVAVDRSHLLKPRIAE
jgi:hypothetical protein